MTGYIRLLAVWICVSFSTQAYSQINFSFSNSKKRRVAQEVFEPIHVSTTVIDHNTSYEVVKKGAHKKFSLRIPEGYSLSRRFEAESDQYLIFIYQYDVFDGGGSQFLLIDKSTLRLVRRKKIGSFNIGLPLIHGNVFFITAAGYAAEFDLSSGRAHWEHSNLFGRPYYFDGLLEGETIEVRGDLVQFGPKFTVNRRTREIVIEENNQ